MIIGESGQTCLRPKAQRRLAMRSTTTDKLPKCQPTSGASPSEHAKLAAAVRQAVLAVLAREQKPGGLLWPR